MCCGETISAWLFFKDLGKALLPCEVRELHTS